MTASAPDLSTSGGRAIFYDGSTTIRHDVFIELDPLALRIRDSGGGVLAEWPYDQLETLSSPEPVLRLGRAGNPALARLEVRDTRLAAAIDELSQPVDRTQRIERRLRSKVIIWSLLATASLLVVAIAGVPRLATALTPFVPYALERRLGAAVDAQARAGLEGRRSGSAFECGHAEKEQAGRVAFDKLMRQIASAANLPLALAAGVVRRPESNAITLPGGHIYVFQGLVDAARSPDELAGVIAHEVGHAAHRDGLRTIIQGAGLSLLFGMLLGDFVGGGAVIFAAKTILQTRYSRDVETNADAYGVMLMSRIGGDPRALGAILTRIAGSTHPGPKLLADHPETRDRVAAIERMAARGPITPLLEQKEWLALKSICSD
jgi:Zn-dependent protease with chaperone function